MDPTACFQRIMSAMEDGDAVEFVAAFQDLADWLAKGGFSPKITSIGKVRQNIGHSFLTRGSCVMKTETVPRRTLTDRPFKAAGPTHTIQTVDPNSDSGPYEFITYRGDERIARYLLT